MGGGFDEGFEDVAGRRVGKLSGDRCVHGQRTGDVLARRRGRGQANGWIGVGSQSLQARQAGFRRQTPFTSQARRPSAEGGFLVTGQLFEGDRKSTRLNSSHSS